MAGINFLTPLPAWRGGVLKGSDLFQVNIMGFRPSDYFGLLRELQCGAFCSGHEDSPCVEHFLERAKCGGQNEFAITVVKGKSQCRESFLLFRCGSDFDVCYRIAEFAPGV